MILPIHSPDKDVLTQYARFYKNSTTTVSRRIPVSSRLLLEGENREPVLCVLCGLLMKASSLNLPKCPRDRCLLYLAWKTNQHYNQAESNREHQKPYQNPHEPLRVIALAGYEAEVNETWASDWNSTSQSIYVHAAIDSTASYLVLAIANW